MMWYTNISFDLNIKMISQNELLVHDMTNGQKKMNITKKYYESP